MDGRSAYACSLSPKKRDTVQNEDVLGVMKRKMLVRRFMDIRVLVLESDKMK